MMTNTQLEAIEDLRILSECIAGRTESQKLLYQYFAPKMFGICLRYANDYHHAEDILQEGFIKVFNNLHKFRREGSFEGWMKRIFINHAIEYYRKSYQFRTTLPLEEVRERSIDTNILDDLRLKDLLDLIQQLPPGYRTVFNLYVIEGYSHKEIAKMLNIMEGTSKSQLARARVALQEMVKTADL